ncbi:hypothetical protein FIBSPDRAFT_479405 [Athelia psychrophila]|uniref:Uncharacterized protein n=1 Tax=Athelia psychrophila TaxID=1759441 RepID=A0A166VCP8_9AGAM|nr:hypothetical protein FIBSPDRAFT_479405 [Fibularhizoctonia sp. CBS 109695]
MCACVCYIQGVMAGDGGNGNGKWKMRYEIRGTKMKKVKWNTAIRKQRAGEVGEGRSRHAMTAMTGVTGVLGLLGAGVMSHDTIMGEVGRRWGGIRVSGPRVLGSGIQDPWGTAPETGWQSRTGGCASTNSNQTIRYRYCRSRITTCTAVQIYTVCMYNLATSGRAGCIISVLASARAVVLAGARAGGDWRQTHHGCFWKHCRGGDGEKEWGCRV